MAEKRKDAAGRVLKTGESQRADGTYMYRYTDILRRRQTIYAPTLQELRKKETEITVREALGLSPGSSKLTVSDLMARHNISKENKRISTQKSYKHRKAIIERYPIAKMKATQVTPIIAKTWLLELEKEGMALGSLLAIGRYLRETYRVAIEQQIMLTNPFQFKLDIFQVQSKKRQALTEQELETYLAFVQEHHRYSRIYNYAAFLADTGLRAGEFLGLTESDIDLESRTVRVERQLRTMDDSTQFYIEKTKTARGVRVIPLTDRAFYVAQQMISDAKKCKLRPEVDGVTGFIVRNNEGGLYADCAFSQRMRDISEDYQKQHPGGSHITPHILRHTFCTNLIIKGVPAHSVQYLMGHSSVSTTLGIYTTVTQSTAARDMMQAVDVAS